MRVNAPDAALFWSRSRQATWDTILYFQEVMHIRKTHHAGLESTAALMSSATSLPSDQTSKQTRIDISAHFHQNTATMRTTIKTKTTI
ncbi:hypothetical protein IMCC20628_04259 [Hoeflea sp. IMCC20628]|nr:hypothetical protein IMCC20628_04259 [Hoeflea sp. IMCC20628]